MLDYEKVEDLEKFENSLIIRIRNLKSWTKNVYTEIKNYDEKKRFDLLIDKLDLIHKKIENTKSYSVVRAEHNIKNIEKDFRTFFN